MKVLAKLIRKAATDHLPHIHKARKKRGYVIGPDAGLELVRKSIEEGWAEGDVLECLYERLEIYTLCRDSLVEQQAERERCSKDIERFFRIWLWTYDPRLKAGKLRPFLLFDLQKDYLAWLEERYKAQEDGAVEKSRDAGFSWLSVDWALHHWLFEDGFAAVFGSNLLRNVDTLGDPKSLFEKIRMSVKYLPDWMLPNGFRKGRFMSSRLRLVNPESGATIVGEGGDQIGRSGRASVVFLDEAAHIERAEAVEASTSQTTECRIWGSTPNGMGNLFYRKVHGGEIPVFRFHWKDDPRKNHYFMRRGEDGRLYRFYPWYERQKRRHSPLTVAQEIDISYAGSIEGMLFPFEWIQAAIDLELPKSKYKSAGLDVGETAADTVLTERAGPVIEKVRFWSFTNTTTSARRTKRYCEEDDIKHLNYDSNGVGAGVTGELVTSDPPCAFTMAGIRWGGKGTASGMLWDHGKRSREMFESNRDEHHWIVRERFRKTYEYTLYQKGDPEGVNHPTEELISIPSSAIKLFQQLPTIKFEERSNGKIKIESKKEMRDRGIASPDHVDSLVLSFVPEKKTAPTTPSASTESM